MIHFDKMTPAQIKDQCILRPYAPDRCPEGTTGHHCVPDHCLKKPDSQGGGRYPGAISHGEGLCVCVSGSTKSKSEDDEDISKKDFKGKDKEQQWFNALAEHGRIHALFDIEESNLGKAGDPPNSATLGDLEDAAAEAVSAVTGCDKDKLKKQMREYHKNKKMNASNKYRADPNGRRKAPPYSQMGSNTPSGGMGR